jgi:hypothetical protein
MPTPRPVPSVLLTTHYLEEAQALASRVVVLAGGRVIAQGGVDDITAQVGLSRVHLRAPSRPELPVGTQVESSNGSHTLYTAHPDGLVGALALQGWRSPGCGWSGPAWSGLPTSDWRSLRGSCRPRSGSASPSSAPRPGSGTCAPCRCQASSGWQGGYR